MKLKTNLVAAFVFAFCFAAIPNISGCDKNGDTTTGNPATKPSVEEHKVVQHPDGSTETKDSKTVKNGDGTVQTHTEEKKTNP